jgi:dihydroorotase
MQELVKLTVQNPANSLGYEAGEIKVGEKADFILFNINEEYTLKNPQSLYDEEVLCGKVL